MALGKKTFRYYYWLAKEFLHKHVKLIAISFVISFLFIIAIISLSPVIGTLVSSKKEIIGIVGSYDINNLPDDIYNKISSGLVFIDEKGDLVPVLANSWEIRDNGMVYRFHLKSNLIWDDGKKFTAHDINYQFKDIVEKVLDDTTIEFHLKSPLSIFPTYLRKPIIKYPLVGIASLYHVSGIKTKYGTITELILEPNKPDLPSLTYKMYQDETQMLSAYKRGDITEFSVTKKSIADSLSSWKNTSISKEIDYTRLMTLFINNNNPLLNQKDIRQAIALAINYADQEQNGQVATGPIPPVSWAYNPDLKKNTYDPDLAGAIIRKSVDATKEATLHLVTFYDYYDLGNTLVSDFKSVGLPVDLNISTTGRSDFDMELALWKVPSDPDQYFFWHSTQTQGNIGHYKNVKIDKLLEDGRNTVSVDDRKKIYYEFQRVMQDDPPAIFLYYPYVYTIKRK